MGRDLHHDTRLPELDRLLSALEKEYGLSRSELVSLTADVRIPLSLFSTGLSALELSVRFLSEQGHGVKAIAFFTGRSVPGAYQALRHSHSKHPAPLPPDAGTGSFPVSVLRGTRPPLEALVTYLKDSLKLRYVDIAKLLHRDQRTVWTAYQRGRTR